jgi:hypothetical protein
VRTTVLLLFRRIFTLNTKWFKWAWWFNLVLNWCIFVSAWVQFSIDVHDSLSGAQALPQYKRILADSIVQIVSDAAILLLPFPLIFKLQLPLKNRAMIMGIFLLGAL